MSVGKPMNFQPLSLDPKRNGAFSELGATPAAVVDPMSGQTLNTATGQPVVDPAQHQAAQDAAMSAQGDAQSAQLQAQTAEQQAQLAQQKAELQAQQKDLEIQKAQQAAEASKAELQRTQQQVKQQEQLLSQNSKQQPKPQLSPAIQKRVSQISKGMKPFDNSALLSMKLAYTGGHSARTSKLISGARALHGAKAPRTATPAEMKPFQQHGGYDWSGYKPRDTADPKNLSGNAGVMSGPRYMQEINSARDRILSQGGNPEAYGVRRIDANPTPTAQPQAVAPADATYAQARATGGALRFNYQTGRMELAPKAAPVPAQPAPQAPVTAPAQPAPVAYDPAKDPAMEPYMGATTQPAAVPAMWPATAQDSALATSYEQQQARNARGDAYFKTPPTSAQPAAVPTPPAPAQPTDDDWYAQEAEQVAADRQAWEDQQKKRQLVPAAAPSEVGSGFNSAPGEVGSGFNSAPSEVGAGFNSAPGEAATPVQTPRETVWNGGLNQLNVMPKTILPPGNPLGLPAAASWESDWPSRGQTSTTQPQLAQILSLLSGQANQQPDYIPLGMMGKMANTPPKPVAPATPGQPRSFDHGKYSLKQPAWKGYDPEAVTGFLSKPDAAPSDKAWAYDQAAKHYFQQWGIGSHNQAADYFASQYPGPQGRQIGQAVAERVRNLANDQIRQPNRADNRVHLPHHTSKRSWGDELMGKITAMSLAPHAAIHGLGATLFDTWKDWTGAGDVERQSQLIPEAPHYGSLSNMQPLQQAQTLAAEADDIRKRQVDLDTWTHRMMGDQQDMGAALSNTWGEFFDANAPQNPWYQHSPLGQGATAIQMGGQMAGDAMDMVREFGAGNYGRARGEALNTLLGALATGTTATYGGPRAELVERAVMYGMGGPEAYLTNRSRGTAIDEGTYTGDKTGEGFDHTGPFDALVGINTQPAKISPQVAERIGLQPTVQDQVGSFADIGSQITEATGEQPGSPGWMQLLSMLLPFLAPLLAGMGNQGNNTPGASTASSYYGPDFYGGDFYGGAS